MGFRDLSYPFLFPMPTRGIPTNPTIDAMVMEIKHPIDPIAFSARKNGTPRSAQKRPSWFGHSRFTRINKILPTQQSRKVTKQRLGNKPMRTCRFFRDPGALLPCHTAVQIDIPRSRCGTEALAELLHTLRCF